jgi:TRAP-type C4-dicarboxylate transport system substrate-binding protein
MRYRSLVPVALSTAVLFAGIAAVPVLAQGSKTGGDPTVTTLRLGVADTDQNDSKAAVDAFVASVAQRSGGSLVIQPTFDAAGGDFELGTIHMLQAGNFDLAMVGTRAWVEAGIDGMAALHAPMLIDDTALAVAVARGDIAQQALDRLGTSGMTGLALWPESLRYFQAYPSYHPILTPDDIRGAVIKTDRGGPGQPFIEAMGGTVWTGSDVAWDVDHGNIQAADSNLHGRGLSVDKATATGNLVLYPKFQSLVMASDAFDRLTADQQDILRQAAADAREAGVGTVADEAAWASDWCNGEGTVVLTDAAGIAAFQAVANQVTDQIRSNPEDAALIDAIEALKSSTPRSAPVAACSYEDGATPYPATDTTGWTGALPTDGSYRAEITYDDLVSKGVTPARAIANAGTSTWTFKDGGATLTNVQAGSPSSCSATTELSPDGSNTIMTDIPGGQCGIGSRYAWKPVEGGIQLLVVVPPGARYTPGEVYDVNEYKAIIENRTWYKIN